MQYQTNSRISDAQHISERFTQIRDFTKTLCKPLNIEDYVIQSMPDVSPAKWHLAHTTWFFERFVLIPLLKSYIEFDKSYNYLFNSYYVLAGERFERARRGVISRPTVKEVFDYREYVDDQIKVLLESEGLSEKALDIMEIGINHEQQHQELLLTDIKHVLSCNPLYPNYLPFIISEADSVLPVTWKSFDEKVYEIGHNNDGFSYDNELPRHKVYLKGFKLASRLVTNLEYIDFINSGGYQNPLLWLSDGWYTVVKENWRAPLYWEKRDEEWFVFTLTGLRKLNPSEPVCHVSFYEADAFARWSGLRLPTEFEWEVASNPVEVKGNLVETGKFHPTAAENQTGLTQMYGDVWEWTQSAYLPYPGFQTAEGALGEYNGKFMSNQMVLRGGSCATSETHIRNTYRNFFPPHARWQFSGLRLAKYT